MQEGMADGWSGMSEQVYGVLYAVISDFVLLISRDRGVY